MYIQHFDKSKLAYIRVIGPYGKNYEPALIKIHRWARTKGLASSLFIYRDNPDTTPAERCRTDICLMVPADTKVCNGIQLQDFPGGSYGVIRKTITDKNQYALYWTELRRELINFDVESDSRPYFQLNHSYDPQTLIAEASFCAPINN